MDEELEDILENEWVDPNAAAETAEWDEIYTQDEIDQRLEARLAEMREQIAAELKAQNDEIISKRQSDIDKRLNKVSESLRAKGLVVTDDGVAVQDQAALLRSMLGGVQETKQEAAPAPEYDRWDGDKQREWFEYQLKQQAAQYEEKLATLFGDLSAATGSVLQPRVNEQVTAVMEEMGVLGLEKRPEFRAVFEPEFDRLPTAQKANDQRIRQLVGYAMLSVPGDIRDEVRRDMLAKKAEAEAQAERERARAAQSGGAPARTTQTGAPAMFGSSDQEAIDKNLLDALGDDPQFRTALRLTNAGNLKSGVPALTAYNQRMKKRR